MDPEVAARQLKKRRDQVARRHAGLADVPADVLDLHPALDLSLRQIEMELDWLDQKLAELERQVSA